jgi:heat shock 70kDa protein 1/2/6/8
MFSLHTAEDELAVARIQAQNGLESYVYKLRKLLADEQPAGEFEAAHTTKLEVAVNETIQWLSASKKEYEGPQKEHEAIINPP